MKGSKSGRAGACGRVITIKLGDETITPPERKAAPAASAEAEDDPAAPDDSLTDIDLDVEADLEDFDE